MVVRFSLTASVFALSLAFLTGCGGPRTADPEALASAQVAYDNAVAEIEAGNHESAVPLLENALAPGGGLPPDVFTEGLVQRAICYARLERFDEALADLDIASQGASDMSAVHVARAFVFKKQGKTKESSQEMSAAKKINRKARPVKG